LQKPPPVQALDSLEELVALKEMASAADDPHLMAEALPHFLRHLDAALVPRNAELYSLSRLSRNEDLAATAIQAFVTHAASRRWDFHGSCFAKFDASRDLFIRAAPGIWRWLLHIFCRCLDITNNGGGVAVVDEKYTDMLATAVQSLVFAWWFSETNSVETVVFTLALWKFAVRDEARYRALFGLARVHDMWPASVLNRVLASLSLVQSSSSNFTLGRTLELLHSIAEALVDTAVRHLAYADRFAQRLYHLLSSATSTIALLTESSICDHDDGPLFSYAVLALMIERWRTAVEHKPLNRTSGAGEWASNCSIVKACCVYATQAFETSRSQAMTLIPAALNYGLLDVLSQTSRWTVDFARIPHTLRAGAGEDYRVARELVSRIRTHFTNHIWVYRIYKTLSQLPPAQFNEPTRHLLHRWAPMFAGVREKNSRRRSRCDYTAVGCPIHSETLLDVWHCGSVPVLSQIICELVKVAIGRFTMTLLANGRHGKRVETIIAPPVSPSQVVEEVMNTAFVTTTVC
jgi:hypothetical protein